jgi:protein-S-isoprenylcysteine O-methyltransferase Ste14
MFKKINPLIYVLILLIASLLVHLYVPLQEIIPEPYNYIGALIALSGLGINYWAENTLRANETAVKSGKKPTKLITTGPYNSSRHPMYLGMTLSLLGIAVLLGSVTPLASPIVFFLISETVFIPWEEEILEKEFGDKYSKYRKNVRRWI